MIVGTDEKKQLTMLRKRPLAVEVPWTSVLVAGTIPS